MCYKETDYGFVYGPLEMTRVCADDQQGWVHVKLKSKKQTFYLHVQKGGKMLFYNESGEKELVLVEKDQEEMNKESYERDVLDYISTYGPQSPRTLEQLGMVNKESQKNYRIAIQELVSKGILDTDNNLKLFIREENDQALDKC